MEPTQPEPIQQPPSIRTNRRKLWGVILLTGPSALIVISLLSYAVINFMFGFGAAGPSIAKTIINILLFLVAGVTVLTWLPGIIIGIILLATKPPISR